MKKYKVALIGIAIVIYYSVLVSATVDFYEFQEGFNLTTSGNGGVYVFNETSRAYTGFVNDTCVGLDERILCNGTGVHYISHTTTTGATTTTLPQFPIQQKSRGLEWIKLFWS